MLTQEENKECICCKNKKTKNELNKLVNILLNHPYASWKNIIEMNFEYSYNLYLEAKKICLQKYIDRIRCGSENIEDFYILSMIITEKKEFELTEKEVEKTVNMYKRKYSDTMK